MGKRKPESTNTQNIKFRYINGDVYTGEWKDGKRNGKGTYTCSDGDVYIGEWENDMRHGKGTYTDSDGDVYEGEWENDMKHGKGAYTYADGNIIVTGYYKNDLCIDFKKIIIKDKQGVKHCFFKEGGILYYQKESEDKQEVSAENKRLEDVLKQLGDPEITENADNVIDCNNPRDFKQEIQKLIEQSQQKEAPPISKIFIIPGHAFTMVFKKGTAYCYDNGAIATHPVCHEYQKVLEKNLIEYKEFSMSKKLSVLLADGSKVEISMPKNSLVCRHLACVVLKKIEALISSGYNIAQGLKRWSKRSQKEGEEETPGTLIARASSPPIKRIRSDL